MSEIPKRPIFVAGLEVEIVRAFVIRRDEPMEYEEASRPRRGVPLPLREISPTSHEGRLLALGWRLVPVPWFHALVAGAAPSLQWDNPTAWLAIPSDDAMPARRFDNRRQALWWAEEQTGLRPAAEGA